MPKRHVLYIEDNDDNFRLVERLLNRMELNLDRAKTAVAGIQMTRQKRYDLILTDILLPDNSIQEAHKQLLRPLRQQIGPNVPLVALTAHAFHFDEAFLLAHGCDHFLAKPIHINEFQEIISRLLARNA